MILGAAFQAAQLTGRDAKSKAKDFKFLDILPLSLGTELLGGISDIIIPRNTPIPASRTKEYTTVYDYQTAIHFKLLEGERMMGSDNNLLGDMTLRGMQLLPAKQAKADVTFKIDENGSLRAQAVERATGQSTDVTIQYTQKRLGNNDMIRMIADAERLRMEDQKKVEDAEARNELEAYCLKLKNKVKMNRDMTVDEKMYVNDECRAVLDWMKTGNRGKDMCLLKRMALKTAYRGIVRLLH